MSFIDKAKDALGQAKEKAGHLAGQHSDKIDTALDKGGTFIDHKTKGKYSSKIDTARQKAREAKEKLAAESTHGPGTGSGPVTGSGPAAGGRVDPGTPVNRVDPTGPADRPDPASGEGQVSPPAEQIDPNQP